MSRFYISSNFLEYFFLLFASALQKATPLLIGYLILRFYGESNYANFAYSLIVAFSATAVISAGVAPSLIVDVLNSENKREVSLRYLKVILVTSAIVISILWVAYIKNYFQVDDFLFVIVLLYGILLSSILSPLLYALEKARKVSASFFALNFLLIVGIFCAKNAGYAAYFKVYALLVFFNALYLLNLSLKYHDQACLDCNENHLRLSDFFLIYKRVSGLFIPNAIWMASLFLFNTYVKENQHTASGYPWFAFGYQLFSFLVFIPNSLLPLFIKNFTSGTQDARRDLCKVLSVSLLYFTCSLFVVIFFICTHSIFPNIFPKDFNVYIFLMSALSGVFAAAIAPLSQWCTSIGKQIYIIIPACIWATVSFICLSVFFVGYSSFLISYSVSYVVFVCLIFFISNNK